MVDLVLLEKELNKDKLVLKYCVDSEILCFYAFVIFMHLFTVL